MRSAKLQKFIDDSLARGESLRRIALHYGVVAEDGESDEALRKRVMKVVRELMR
ncbi:hypothetical protein [Hyphomicrobium sp.]|uniref:hypothetical protein n=1 Tax=Hyphomicrobium sp. TaxID=82 RepID=UPI001E0221A3|nr:hypothetical protein [Hyphomicrobium sp.]MBY0559845.1 hypothetical protein [Hyphomicrobium sp.]